MVHLDLIVITKKLSILILFSFLILLSFFGHLGQAQAPYLDEKLNVTVTTDRSQIAPDESLILYVQVKNVGVVNVTNISVTLGLPEGFESSPNDTTIRLTNLIPNETNFTTFRIKALSNVTPNSHTVMVVVNSTNAPTIVTPTMITIVSKIIRLILLNTSIVVILFGIFIIFADNRNIEGVKKREENYIPENIQYPFALLLALIILAESVIYVLDSFSRLEMITIIGTIVWIVLLSMIIIFLYKYILRVCKENDNDIANQSVLTRIIGCIRKIFLGKIILTDNTDIKKDIVFLRAFHRGLYMLLIYSIFVAAFTTIMVLIIGSIYGNTEIYIFYLYILLSLVLLFTTIFTYIMAGYLGPLLLGLISGIVLFLVIVSWRFSVPDISLGGFMIPIFVPASSFLGALCSLFVDLYYHPSRLIDIEEDYKKLREFIARIFASIILGLFVYAATLPANNPSLSKSVSVLIGFASGFYISPMLSFLRKKIFSLIDESLLKEDDRKRIIKDIEEDPDKYSILSDDEIKHIANQTGMDEKELRKLIIKRDIEEDPNKYSILSDNKKKHIANQIGIDEMELRELIKEGERKRIIKDIEENPEQYYFLSNHEMKHIIDQTGIDKEEFEAIISFIKKIGTKAAEGLAKWDVHIKEDLLSTTSEKLEEMRKKDGIDYVSLKKSMEAKG